MERRNFLQGAALLGVDLVAGRKAERADGKEGEGVQAKRELVETSKTGNAVRGNRKNILFLITDQQRGDCFSVLGHPVIRTPNYDRLAKKGTLFSEAFIQSSMCGPSRACIDTGRYMHSHRLVQNEVPFPADEVTMGTYFHNAGYRAAWIGKGYYTPDYYYHSEYPVPELKFDYQWYPGPPPGWENWAYDMGGPHSPYAVYRKKKGYPDDVFTTGQGGLVKTPQGELLRPSEFRASWYPTVIKAEDSETAFFATRAIDFIQEAKKGEKPWLLQVNFFSPHTPFVAPAPYHAMYDPNQVTITRNTDELKNPHPLHKLMRFEQDGTALDDEEVCRKLRAVYYGMISEVDHNVGRILDYLESEGLMANTIIVCSSDHGEYVGDHWCVQKELWFDAAYHVPLIVYDPSPSADKSRGHIQEAFAGEIDILPTLLDACGLEIPYAIDGKSLMPLIREGKPPADWRTEIYSEWDFRFFWSMHELGLDPHQCRMWMVRDMDFKYVYFSALPHILYDLRNDPDEFHNVADNAKYTATIAKYREKLMNWRMNTEDNSRAGWTYARRPKFGPDRFRFSNPWPEQR